MILLDARTRQALTNLDATFKALDTALIGRHGILEQIKLALLTGNNVLLSGPPGVAKTYMVRLLFDALEDCRTFRIQCTKKMTEEYLVGPLDMKLFREEGAYRHRTEGTLVDSHYAYVDEFMDLSPNTLRSLLEILNERTFTRGTQFVKAPLRTCIASSNFTGENDEALQAVLDRFIFKAKVVPLTTARHKMALLEQTTKKVEIPKLSHKDLALLRAKVRQYTIPNIVLQAYVGMSSNFPSVTDRYLVKCLDVIKASALLRRSSVVGIEDLPSLEACFTTVNDPQTQRNFSAAMQSIKSFHDSSKAEAAISAIEVRAAQLRSWARRAEDYETLKPTASEAVEALGALSKFSAGIATDTSRDAARRAHAILSEIVRTADALWATTKENA